MITPDDIAGAKREAAASQKRQEETRAQFAREETAKLQAAVAAGRKPAGPSDAQQALEEMRKQTVYLKSINTCVTIIALPIIIAFVTGVLMAITRAIQIYR